ncbi:DUF721 family protein [Rhodococcus rhodnii]|uniref:UPF0232 protein Rrhod_2956 n=2 Tax=Rhodococcus rhodnii TaxID=38312 RepID=R7WK36_9NOCA|nr:DUF721 family protein [Rhodococcus rhodnii]EOM75686.1 hypothetical protein Rrhod_2956 [Rhodococcus rhodnii LMG 5362]TXG89668.1 DUF721 family protein [Rhodococcus rhodnii]
MSDGDAAGGGTPEQPRGVDIARRALEEARAAAKAKGQAVGQGRASGVRALRSGRGRGRRGWSGPGPDARDPQLLGALTGALSKQRGWSGKVSEGVVFGRWEDVVGPDIAAHAQPTALRDQTLSVSAESTAWATQLRMMQPQILARIADAVGNGVVRSLTITGPTAPSWRKGERHIRGRGPRDTYG